MIEIKPFENASQYVENADNHTYVLVATDGDEVLGYGVVRLFDTYAVIDDIHFENDTDMLALGYGMGKALLNFIERRSVYHVYSSLDNPRLLERLRFKKDMEIKTEEYKPDENECYVNLEGYFDTHC